jgi:uncharacterized membrane protein YkvA (DUF1232 family)
MLAKIKAFAARLKREILALYFVGRDSRTPRHVKIVIGLVIAYALSPIDLIPDFIPVLGYVDDLVLLPLGIWLAIRLTPPEIFQAARANAALADQRLPRNWRAAAVIVLLWLGAAILIAHLVLRKFPRDGAGDASLGY